MLSHYVKESRDSQVFRRQRRMMLRSFPAIPDRLICYNAPSTPLRFADFSLSNKYSAYWTREIESLAYGQSIGCREFRKVTATLRRRKVGSS